MADKFSSINEKSIFTLKTISIYMLNYGDVRIKLLIVRLRARPNHRLVSIEMAIGGEMWGYLTSVTHVVLL
jgi:hypothetical protein